MKKSISPNKVSVSPNNQDAGAGILAMFQTARDWNEKHPRPLSSKQIRPRNEKELEKLFGQFLEAQGISVQHQVTCAAGIADIVTSDAIYEIKDTLDANSLFSAIGQVSVYRQQINPSAKAFIVGRPGPLDVNRKEAIVSSAQVLGIEILFWE